MSRRVVTGRLVFRQAGPPVPLHHLTVEGPSGARATTDLDGCFTLEVPGHGPVALRLVDEDPRYTSDGIAAPTERVVGEVHVTPGDDDHCGDVMVAWWPYRDDFPVPRVAPVDGKLPQAYTKGFFHTLELAVARTVPAKAILEADKLRGDGHPTVAEIQAHQPKVRSIVADEAHPGTSRSDAWLGDLLLNGFNVAATLGRDAADPALLRYAIRWGELPVRTDGPAFDVTDVDVVLDPTGDEVLPVRITLDIRSPGVDGTWRERRVESVPGDALWDSAKHVVRCQNLLQGALDGHIVTTHFQTEAAAVAVFRNLRKSPVRALLAPQLQEIVAQDHDGDGFAWGPHGILLEQSGLTVPAVERRIAQLSASLCWQHFAPPVSVHPTHRYAQAAERYWALIGRYVAGFFADHHDEIVANWAEVHRMSQDLVRTSPPYDPLPRIDGVVPLREAPPVRRETIDKVERSCPAITRRDEPQGDDIARLAQWCTVVLYRATFEHTWTHDGQYDAGGDLRLATFGLRAGSLGADDDPALLPPTDRMLQAIETNTIGIHANYGFLLADEERDVPPALKAALSAEREAFSALGVDVARIRSRINI
ncbi:MAG: hypothetical protein R3F59_18180 [Myxococcota bacterium]